MKQLYVKATGTAYGPAPDKKKSKKGKNKDGQPKQMDTRKADKAKKVGSSSLAAEPIPLLSLFPRAEQNLHTILSQ